MRLSVASHLRLVKRYNTLQRHSILQSHEMVTKHRVKRHKVIHNTIAQAQRAFFLIILSYIVPTFPSGCSPRVAVLGVSCEAL